MPRVVQEKKSLARKVGKSIDTLKKGRGSPLWKGPESDDPNGGITFSALSRFLCCRERFRLVMIEGLRPADGFNHKIEYGQMWHACEEAHAAAGTKSYSGPLPMGALRDYAQDLCKQYPMSQ